MEREIERFDLRIGNTVTGHRSNIIENTGSRLERCLSNRGVYVSHVSMRRVRIEWHTNRYESLYVIVNEAASCLESVS